MRLLALFFCFFCCSVFVPALAHAQDSEFTIRVFAGSDSDPPTTPTLLSATAISQTQVDLAWTISTDNFALGGYVVTRGSSTIATTTLTTFSDTGLSASTTYTYSVRAFDSSGNYSSSSNSISVTTPDFPIEPLQPEPGQGTVARVVPESVAVTPDISSATFAVTTRFPARFEIRWGRTESYELGYIASDILRREYTTILTGLEPGTSYNYEIVGYTPYGNSGVIENGRFRTLDDIDLSAPANVRRFQAVQDGGNVQLSWQLPYDADLAHVRIVRSHLDYPVNPNDGAIIYQGLATNAVDQDVLFRYSPAFYTAFVYDTSGNVSSGAIARVFADWSDSGSVDRPTGIEYEFDPGLESIATTTQRIPDAFDILIKQIDREFSFADEVITLAYDELFLFHLPSDRVTSNLKSIIVNLQDPTDQRKSFSFLLRLNKDQTAYEAIVSPLQVVGDAGIVLSVYDFRAFRVAEYRTQISFRELHDIKTQAELERDDARLFWQFILTTIIFVLAVLWWLVGRRRTDDRDEDNLTAEFPHNTV